MKPVIYNHEEFTKYGGNGRGILSVANVQRYRDSLVQYCYLPIRFNEIFFASNYRQGSTVITKLLEYVLENMLGKILIACSDGFYLIASHEIGYAIKFCPDIVLTPNKNLVSSIDN